MGTWSEFVASTCWSVFVALICWFESVASTCWSVFVAWTFWSGFVVSTCSSVFVASTCWSVFLAWVGCSVLLASISWSDKRAWFSFPRTWRLFSVRVACGRDPWGTTKINEGKSRFLVGREPITWIWDWFGGRTDFWRTGGETWTHFRFAKPRWTSFSVVIFGCQKKCKKRSRSV